MVALIFSISDIKGFYSLQIFSEIFLFVLVDGKESLCTREGQGEPSGPFDRLPGKRESRKMSHSRAGRCSGLTSRGAVLKYLSTKIRAGEDEDLDSRVHGQTGTRLC